ncbi:MAG: chorismate mutase [Azospirillaceae bacterium]|nr:chorismate mutase [Azospirillaceae bacterium]
MSTTSPTLNEIRLEIDSVDDAVHDLLMRRCQLVEAAGHIAAGGGLVRPGREAMIMRRLIARHHGNFPVPVLARMWREMVSGLNWLQGPLAVAVYAPEDRRGFWDIARDHYGSQVPMFAVNTAIAAVRAVAEGTATVAVVPCPEDDDGEPWWPALMGDDGKVPRVTARLPFCGRGNARGDDRDALALSRQGHDPTGDDRTLLAIELSQDMSRGRLKDALEGAGMKPVAFRSPMIAERGGRSLHLVEVADYIDAGSPDLARLRQRTGDLLQYLIPIGGYAVPIAMTKDPRKS